MTGEIGAEHRVETNHGYRFSAPCTIRSFTEKPGLWPKGPICVAAEGEKTLLNSPWTRAQ